MFDPASFMAGVCLALMVVAIVILVHPDPPAFP